MDYHVVVGLPAKLALKINDVDFWVTQNMKDWVKLECVSCEMMKRAK